MDPLTNLVKALVQAGWRPISAINIVGTCGVIFVVSRLPVDPAPTTRNLVSLGVLIAFVFVCMVFIAVTADEREP